MAEHTGVDLDAIKARESKATAGPWEPQDRDYRERGIAVIAVIPEVPTGGTPTRGMVTWVGQGGANFGKPSVQEANGEFIAHARTDVPALIAEVERLRAEVAALQRGDLQRVANIGATDVVSRFLADALMWATCDLDVHGEGPSGGFVSRVKRATEAYEAWFNRGSEPAAVALQPEPLNALDNLVDEAFEQFGSRFCDVGFCMRYLIADIILSSSRAALQAQKGTTDVK